MKEQYTKKDFPYLYFQTVQCYGRCGVRGKPLQSKERQYGDLVLPSRIEGDGAVVEILHEAFMNAKGLTSIVIPEGVEEIGDKAFFGCTALRAVRLPSTLKRIGDHAFCGCTGMTEPLRLPAGVESIGDGAFAGTPLMATDLEGDRYAFVGGALVETKGGRLLWANAVTDLPQNGSIKIIGPYAYAYCKALRQIALPEGVWKIQEHAFDGCVCLERIDLPESLKEIGREILTGAEKMISLRIPEGVWRVSHHAFAGLPMLKTLMIPMRIQNSVESFGISRACNVVVAHEEESKTGARLSICRAVRFAAEWTAEEKRITVARDRITPADTYFEVALPDDDGAGNTVTAIADSGFADCANLTTVIFPSTVKRIGKAAFSRCKSLTTVRLSPELLEIGRDAFHGCEALDIEIPLSVLTIDAGALCGVRSVRVAEDHPRYYVKDGCLIDREKCAVIFGSRDAEIPADGTVREIAYKAFYKQEELRRIRIPAAVVRIGSDAFGKCGALAEVEIEDGLLELASYAFRGCTALREITLPRSVTTVGEHILSGCTAVRSVTFCKRFLHRKNEWTDDVGAGKECKFTVSDSFFRRLMGKA